MKHSFLMDSIPALFDCLKSCDIIPDVTESDRKSETTIRAEESQGGCPSSTLFLIGALGACEGSDFGFFVGL